MENAKETFNQRIKKLISQSKYKNLRRFHLAIVEKAGEDAISYTSLRNAIHQSKKPHEKTLFQIANILGIEIYDLIKGTNIEPSINGPASGYIQLNSTSILHNLYHGLPFKPQLLKVEGYGESIEEQNVFFDAKCFRFLYIIRGTIDLILKHKDREQERRELKKGDVFCFDASILHYFKNNNTQYAEILITNFKQGLPYDQ
jgi:hypothetical protein